MEEVGQENVVEVVTDKTARELLMLKEHLYSTLCVAHC